MFKKENYLLALLALTLGSFNTSVFAQDDAADDVEEVITTGTRIKSDGFEAVSPVAVVSATDIKKTGLVRMEDVLNQMPQIETANTSFEPSGETGTASLDLRGLGGARTLTLINGRRMQPGSIWSEDADIGQIPVALIERVDVLTGGASAVYGSDAVAGVVNFVTRKVNGLEVSLSKGGYRHDNDGKNLVVPL
jgi:iron complex outermembrane receptor protein